MRFYFRLTDVAVVFKDKQSWAGDEQNDVWRMRVIAEVADGLKRTQVEESAEEVIPQFTAGQGELGRGGRI